MNEKCDATCSQHGATCVKKTPHGRDDRHAHASNPGDDYGRCNFGVPRETVIEQAATAP